MFELICISTGLLLGAGAIHAYMKTKDAFHPAVVVAPLFMFSYSLWPLLLNWNGGLEAYLSADDLSHVAWIYFVTLAAFLAGALTIPRTMRRLRGAGFDIWNIRLPAHTLQRIYWLSVALGLVAVAAYWNNLDNVGGFVEAYSRAKGGGRSTSGYFGEAILLSFPAVLLLAISRRGFGRLTLIDISLALIMVSPHLLQGIFGGRRGPLFLSLFILFIAWYIARGKRPSLKRVFVSIVTFGLIVIFVQSQRQHLFLGSEGEFKSELFVSKFMPDEVEPGNTYLFGVGSILTAEYYDRYYWGFRYFVTFIIRPIPKQIWPTKYEDVGAGWFAEGGGGRSFEQAVGFRSPNGSAMPSIADGYLEFSWGVVILFYLIGRTFSSSWGRHRTRGGVWTVIFVVMLILSIYLATQSFSAWAHRLLFVAVPTMLLWKFWIEAGGGVAGGSARSTTLPIRRS